MIIAADGDLDFRRGACMFFVVCVRSHFTGHLSELIALRLLVGASIWTRGHFVFCVFHLHRPDRG